LLIFSVGSADAILERTPGEKLHNSTAKKTCVQEKRRLLGEKPFVLHQQIVVR